MQTCLVRILSPWFLVTAGAAPQTAQPVAGAAVAYEIVAGTKASYLVREQLLGVDFPNDAVGTTTAVTGRMLINPDGRVREGAKVSVDLRSLKSDSDRRDGYLRMRTLETDKYPSADFVPRRVQGLPMPVPASGKANVQLIGDMTIRGVTSELTWAIEAAFAGDRVTGRAKTNFPFGKFNMTIPRLRALLSVDDNIRLELDLVLQRQSVK